MPTTLQYLIIGFDTDPEKQDRIMEVINEEIATIIKDGPLSSDIEKERAAMLKDHEQDLRDNDWWQSVIFRYYRYGENYVEEYVPAVQAITGESVRKMLEEVVKANNRIEVVMLPE